MDIGTEIKASEDGAKLNLKDKKGNPAINGTGEPVTITLAGTDSARWRKAEDVIGNRRLKRANPRTGAGAGAKSMEEQRDDRAFLLASVTLEWHGIVVNGQPWECSPEKAKELYLVAPFIAEQVDEFITDKANF